MPAEKRKRAASTAEPAQKAKISKQNKFLTDLPIEIIDNIVRYALPDLTSIRALIDKTPAVAPFVAPISRTCKMLRKRCHEQINTEYIWICLHLDMYREEVSDCIEDELMGIPMLPRRLWSQIPKTAPRLRIVAEDASSMSDQAVTCLDPEVTYIAPFNFNTMVRIFYSLGRTSVWVRPLHCVGSKLKLMQHLLIPALSVLSDANHLALSAEADYRTTFEVSHLKLKKYGEWELDSLTDRVKCVLQRASMLAEDGYVDEADLLLLSSYWIRQQAERFLPSPGSWSQGEIDPAEAHDWRTTKLHGRCAAGNRLRSLIHQLEHRACLGRARIQEEYGQRWCDGHPIWGIDLGVRFLEMPNFTWFGLSVTELAEFYYGRARTYETTNWNDSGEGDTSDELLVLHEDQATELYFARLLDPENETYRQMQLRLHEIISDPIQMSDIEERAHAEFVLISTNVANTEPEEFVWASDHCMSQACGGREAVIQYLPMAQKGLEISPTVNEWACTLPPKVRKAFLQQGRLYEEDANYFERPSPL